MLTYEKKFLLCYFYFVADGGKKLVTVGQHYSRKLEFFNNTKNSLWKGEVTIKIIFKYVGFHGSVSRKRDKAFHRP